MATTGNSPCTVTRVIERVGERISTVAKSLDALAETAAQREGRMTGSDIADLQRNAAELRQCAMQLTGRSYV